MPSSRESSRIKPRSPALQADSLPSEPPGKPKNTGVGNLCLLRRNSPSEVLNKGLLHCRWILYQLSYPGSSAYTYFPSYFHFLFQYNFPLFLPPLCYYYHTSYIVIIISIFIIINLCQFLKSDIKTKLTKIYFIFFLSTYADTFISSCGFKLLLCPLISAWKIILTTVIL